MAVTYIAGIKHLAFFSTMGKSHLAVNVLIKSKKGLVVDTRTLQGVGGIYLQFAMHYSAI